MITVEALGTILLMGSRTIRVEELRQNKDLATLQLESKTSVAVVLCLSEHVRFMAHLCLVVTGLDDEIANSD